MYFFYNILTNLAIIISPVIIFYRILKGKENIKRVGEKFCIYSQKKNKTTIVIAHRLSTILNANQIYVVENGKILENGTHENLLKNSLTYKNFYEKQLRKS